MTAQSPKRVDVNVPRFNQALVACLAGIAFILQIPLLVGAVFAILATTRFLGPQYGVFTQIYLRFVKPRLSGPTITEPADPPRFAQLLGVVFLGGASLLFVAGFDGIGWIITLMVTALATLAATARICVGCIIYERATGT